MESYALLLGSTLSAGTVLAIAALGLLINEKAGIVNLGAELLGLVLDLLRRERPLEDIHCRSRCRFLNSCSWRATIPW